MKRDEVTALLTQHHFAPATARALTAEMPAEAEPADYAKRLMDVGDDRHLELPSPVIDWARGVRAAAAKSLPVNLQVTQDEIVVQEGAPTSASGDPNAPELPEGGTVTDMTPEELARLDAMTAGGVLEIEPARKKRRGKKVDA